MLVRRITERGAVDDDSGEQADARLDRAADETEPMRPALLSPDVPDR